MEISSQEPPSQFGPTYAPAPPRRSDRAYSRGVESSREAARLLPPDLEIAADSGVPLERLMATVVSAPTDVNPLHALFADGVISEERYYRALAERLGCAYYLGSPRFAEDFDTAR